MSTDAHEIGRLRPEVKEQWLAALRSDEYQQGSDYLHTVDTADDGEVVHRYCCLGVLCELAVQEGVIPPGEGYDGQETEVAYDDENMLPPLAVVEWAYARRPGDSACWAVPDGSYKIRDLASLNDAGVPFTEIADRIEVGL